MPLEEIIKNIITSSDADLYCKKADWKNATASQDGAFCERKNIVVELQGGKKRYKYH